jgi:hypothetical protein
MRQPLALIRPAQGMAWRQSADALAEAIVVMVTGHGGDGE